MRRDSPEATPNAHVWEGAMVERATRQDDLIASLGGGARWALPMPLAVLDRDGIIRAVNEAWARYARDEGAATLVNGDAGMNYLDMCEASLSLASRGGREVARGIRAALQKEQAIFAHHYPCVIAAQTRWCLLHVASLPDAQGGALVTHIEIGERPHTETGTARLLAAEQPVRIEAELKGEDAEGTRVDADAIAQQLRRVQLVTDPALASFTLDTLITVLLNRIRAIIAVDNVTVQVVTEDGRDLSVYATAGSREGADWPVPIGQGVSGRIAIDKRPLIVEDLSTTEVVNPALRARARSLAGVPLLVEDRLIGVLYVDTAEAQRFTQSDIQLLQLAAERIAMAVERARLRQLYEKAEASHIEADVRAGHLDAMFEAMTDGVLVCDRKRRVIRANHAYRELMAVINASGTDVTPLSERVGHLDVRDAHGKRLRPAQFPVQRILRGEELGGAAAQDLRVRAADGSERELTVSGAPVRDGEGHITGAVVVLRDVTERQHLERRTEQALQALLDMAEAMTHPEGVPGAKVDAAGADGVARRLAELARRVLGCERISLAVGDGNAERMKPLATVGWRPEDEQQWLETVGQFGLSDYLSSEQVAQVQAGLVVVNDLREARQRGMPTHGAESALIAPMHIGSELIGVLGVDYGLAPHIFSEAERALAGATAHLAALVLERNRLLHDREEGRVRELALQETTQRMDDFLAIASHDLRSPLTAAIGGVEFAALKFEQLASDVLEKAPDLTESVEAVRRCMTDADQHVMRLSRLVALLFDTARAQTGSLDLHLEPRDLVGIVEEQVATLRMAHPQRTIQLKQPTGGQIPVVVDADRIGEVVTNYVNNALKYSSEDEKIVVHVKATGTTARVSVKDRGPGLAASDQQRIWERFYRVPGIKARSGSASGLGLGLHICKMLVCAHGGQVGVVSAVGKGSTFWFTLPQQSASD